MFPVFLTVSTADPQWADIAVRAEAAGVDAIVLTDAGLEVGAVDASDGTPPAAPTESPIEPSVALARLAAITERIGLVGTLSATYNDPLELARRLADLDYLSAGRVGWRVAPDLGPHITKTFGGREPLTAGQEARRRNELVESVLARWDERTELRSPQGRPVLVGPADTVSADVVLLPEPDADVRSEVRSRAAFLGRAPESVLVLVQIGTDVPVGRLEELVRSERVDGFDVRAGDVEELFGGLLPELRGRGLVREPSRASTLRAGLNLEVPVRRPSLVGSW
jgi:alkanesulfonate monooxygenase SsuD/methylene tetrahydromethanopterin reductase-like flavin-dependent oxidoreductase (luciferase family)